MTGDFTIGYIGGDAVGVGHGAEGSISKGVLPDSQLVELHKRLAELRALVERHAAELDDRDTARDALAEADSEARSGNPQPRRLNILLSAITGAASSVSAVTTAVTGIRPLLQGFG
jgi:uncharacterized small protein (DUF1192 family)